MPELPEVETIRRTVAPVIGRRVSSVRLLRRDVVITRDDPFGGMSRARGDRTSRQRRVRDEELLAGARIAGLSRHGKQLAVLSDSGRVVVIQLGMSGRIAIHNSEAAREAHTHIEWLLDDGSLLRFIDPRRFGGVRTLERVEELNELWTTTLGPDALDVRADALHQALSRTSRPIKSALLDQRVVAGVGNIYADEALFASRLHPERLASDLSPGEVKDLAKAIRKTLRLAVEHRGSTLRDYRDASGSPGAFASRHAVYGRSGQACQSCGSVLCSASVAQRTTVWCPRCQRRPPTGNTHRAAPDR